jgi:hypothetical protein
MDLLRPQVPAGQDLEVRFDGGVFNDAEDLRSLNDRELRSLSVRTTDVNVILDRYVASAVGKQELADDIYNRWARTKQRDVQLWQRQGPRLLMMLLGFLALASLAIFLSYHLGPTDADADGEFEAATTAELIGSIAPLAILGLVFVILLVKVNDIAKGQPAVVIKPFSRDQYRVMLENNRHPRMGWIVAALGIVVGAVIAIVVPLITQD